METFGWLESLIDELAESPEHGELASSIRRLWVAAVLQDSPHWEQHYQRVLDGAQVLGNGWLELAARSFAQQLRVARDGEGLVALPDALASVERAAEPDCVGCPQTVCVLQNLASTYTVIDRVGYLEERLATIDKALAVVEPDATCYHCLHREKAEAFHDLGRYEDALSLLDHSDSLLPTDDEYPGWHLIIRPETLIGLGRLDDALAWMNEADDYDDDTEDSSWYLRQVVKSYVLAKLGQIDDAEEVLPPLSELKGGDYLWWARAVDLLVSAGKWENDWQLGAALGRVIDELIAKGNGAAIEIAEIACRRSVQRGSRWASEKAYARLRDAQDNLREPGRVDPIADDLREKLNALGAEGLQLPVPADRLIEHLSENRDPEKELDLLFLGRATDPDDDQIAVQLSHALVTMDEAETAREVLSDALTQKPTSRVRAGELFGLLQKVGTEEDRRALAQRLAVDQPSMSEWVLASVAFDAGDYPEAIRLARSVIGREEEAFNARRLWARAELRLGNAEDSLRLNNDLIERQEAQGMDTTSDQWDSMSAASLCGAWGLVRDRARALGMTFADGEGPIDEEWNVVRVAYDERDQDGDPVVCSAVRTGPVTARVISVAPPPYPVKTNDIVVFDAAPLNPRPDDEDEAEGWTPMFPVVGLLREGYMTSWIIDGASPPEDQWASFRDELRTEGWGVWSMSPEDYTITDPRSGDDDLPGIYAAVAVPLGVTPTEAHHRLRDLTSAWTHPIAWPELVKAADVDEAERARQRKIVEEYGL